MAGFAVIYLGHDVAAPTDGFRRMDVRSRRLRKDRSQDPSLQARPLHHLLVQGAPNIPSQSRKQLLSAQTDLYAEGDETKETHILQMLPKLSVQPGIWSKVSRMSFGEELDQQQEETGDTLHSMTSTPTHLESDEQEEQGDDKSSDLSSVPDER